MIHDAPPVKADPRGIEPAYVWASDRGVRMAASLTELLEFQRAQGVRPTLDEIALGDTVTFGTPLGRRTLVRGVVRLHPGEILEPGGTPSQPVWPRRPALDPADREGWVDAYIDALGRAIDDRVDPRDVLGCTLSGGLDSRTLLALLRDRGHAPRAITFGTPGHPDREVAVAVAKAAGAEHLVTDIPPDGPLPHLDEVARVTGGTGNLALLAGVCSHAEAAGKVDLLVSGASGDALFGPLPAAAPGDPQGLHAALSPLRDDRRRALLTDAPSVDERLEEARALPCPPGGGDGARLVHLLRWRQATVIADGVRLRKRHTPVLAPFLGAHSRALALGLPPDLREGRTLQQLALERLAPDLARLPRVPAAPARRATRAARYLRGRADHLARNLWLRGTPDRNAQFDIHSALRKRPAWRAAAEGLCAAPPPGIDPGGLARLWRRHLRGRDNLGLLFGRLLVLHRFVERYLG